MALGSEYLFFNWRIAMKADYNYGGGWGNSITWTDSSQFQTDKDWEKLTFSVTGFKMVVPKVGDTLIAEFAKSFIKFEFTKVRRMTDPSDMFFGEVKPIEQEMK